MPVIQQITLKRDYKGVPKGTVCRIPTSSEADHSTTMIPRALRKQGFFDEDLTVSETPPIGIGRWSVGTPLSFQTNWQNIRCLKQSLPRKKVMQMGIRRGMEL